MPIFEKLKKLRQLKNLSQTEIAEKLFLSQNAYSLIETGKTKIDEERIIQLAKIFEIQPFELFLENDKIDESILMRSNNNRLEDDSNNNHLILHLETQINQKDKLIENLMRKNEILVTILNLNHQTDLLLYKGKKFEIT